MAAQPSKGQGRPSNRSHPDGASTTPAFQQIKVLIGVFFFKHTAALAFFVDFQTLQLSAIRTAATMPQASSLRKMIRGRKFATIRQPAAPASVNDTLDILKGRGIIVLNVVFCHKPSIL